MRALRAGGAGNGLVIVAIWTVSMTGGPNVTAVGKMHTPRSDASIVVSVLSESANAAETAMETENGTGNIVSANGTPTVIEIIDASASGIATGNETVTVTVNEETDTDGTKRIAIGRAGRTAK
jgi:hypothetical protein